MNWQSFPLYRLEKANSKSGVEWVAILQSKVVLQTASDHNLWNFHGLSYKLMRLQNIKKEFHKFNVFLTFYIYIPCRKRKVPEILVSFLFCLLFANILQTNFLLYTYKKGLGNFIKIGVL